jgi:hypothetical protein
MTTTTKLQLNWVKLTNGNWPSLQTVNLSNITTTGIYIIWHGGNPGKVVRVGQGIIPNRLISHRQDRQILAYQAYGLYVTWAAAAQQYLDGVERFLAETWNPLVGDRFPDAYPIAVNSPWG